MGVAIAATLALCATWLAELYDAPKLAPLSWPWPHWAYFGRWSASSGLPARAEMSLFAARALYRICTGRCRGNYSGPAWLGRLVACCLPDYSGVGDFRRYVDGDPVAPEVSLFHTLLRHLAQFSRSFIAANILTSITEKIDSLVIGLVLDVTAVGYYALALKVLQTIGLITMNPLQAIMMPVLARLTLQRDKFVNQYSALVTASMATSLPALAGIGVVASTLFPLAFGEHWAGAVPVLRVMCFACFTMPLWNFTGQALSALGQPQYFARLALTQLVLAAVSFTIAANFGLVAVAAASVGVSALMVPLHLGVLQRSVGLILTPLLVNAAKIALGGIVMVVVMMLTRDVTGIGFAATCVQIAIGGMVYLALLDLILPGYVVNLTRKAWAVLPLAGAAR